VSSDGSLSDERLIEKRFVRDKIANVIPFGKKGIVIIFAITKFGKNALFLINEPAGKSAA
jgi:hypothetical protein